VYRASFAIPEVGAIQQMAGNGTKRAYLEVIAVLDE
jgi:hypothetical protein